MNMFEVKVTFSNMISNYMVMNLNMQDFFSGEDFTIVKKKGDDMEILRREGQKITKYKTVQGATPDASSPQKKGKRLGVMYETESGETILVPSE